MNEQALLRLTRQELRDRLGEPTAEATTSRRRPYPSVLRYDKVEFHFDDCGRHNHGRVWLVYTEDKDGNPTTLAKVRPCQNASTS